MLKSFLKNSLVAAGILIAFSGHAVIEDFELPFIVAMERLKNKTFQAPKFSSSEFSAQALYLLSLLKKKKKDWRPLLNSRLDDAARLAPVAAFKNKDYVSRVFSTKTGTLVFQVMGFPHVVVKIDGRANDQFDEAYRDYLTSSLNSQTVRGAFDFSHLYVPMEEGVQSRRLNARFVFSEKIPLFSDAEIDNRVLLHFLIERSNTDAELRRQVKTMYSQMIRYICMSNFDDLTYGNLPFTSDLRFAPFDTDSGLANTGVHSFLRLFFGYKILTADEVRQLISETCPETYATAPDNIDELYGDTSVEDRIFDANGRTIESMLKFLATRSDDATAKFKLADVVAEDDKPYATVLDDVLRRKLRTSRSNLKLFGKHCDHITDVLLAADQRGMSQFPGATMFDLEPRFRRILSKGRLHGIIYAAMPITNKLAGQKSLRSFICF